MPASPGSAAPQLSAYWRAPYVVATRSPRLVSGVVPAERVVSRPRVRGGAVELEVCGRDGQVRPVRVLQRHPQEFRAARSLRWGSRWEPADQLSDS